eukprot:gene26449-biopygen16499
MSVHCTESMQCPTFLARWDVFKAKADAQ